MVRHSRSNMQPPATARAGSDSDELTMKEQFNIHPLEVCLDSGRWLLSRFNSSVRRWLEWDRQICVLAFVWGSCYERQPFLECLSKANVFPRA